MPDLSKTEIIGHIGKEPEMKFMPSGKPVTTFSVAVNRAKKDGEDVEPDWFTIATFGKLAESVNQYVSKGMLVFVSGRIKLSQWEGKDGKIHSRIELSANQVIFLERVKDSHEPDDDYLPDDVPF